MMEKTFYVNILSADYTEHLMFQYDFAHGENEFNVIGNNVESEHQNLFHLMRDNLPNKSHACPDIAVVRNIIYLIVCDRYYQTPTKRNMEKALDMLYDYITDMLLIPEIKLQLFIPSEKDFVDRFGYYNTELHNVISEKYKKLYELREHYLVRVNTIQRDFK